jgi:hypothetical protein
MPAPVSDLLEEARKYRHDPITRGNDIGHVLHPLPIGERANRRLYFSLLDVGRATSTMSPTTDHIVLVGSRPPLPGVHGLMPAAAAA